MSQYQLSRWRFAGASKCRWGIIIELRRVNCDDTSKTMRSECVENVVRKPAHFSEIRILACVNVASSKTGIRFGFVYYISKMQFSLA